MKFIALASLAAMLTAQGAATFYKGHRRDGWQDGSSSYSSGQDESSASGYGRRNRNDRSSSVGYERR